MQESHPYRIMLAVSELSTLTTWATMANALAKEQTEFRIRGMVTVPADKSLSEAAINVRQYRDALQHLAISNPDLYERADVRVDYCPMERILDEIPALDIDLLVLQWEGPSALTGGLSTNEILQQAECDLVLVHGKLNADEGPVLLSLRGGPNLTLGVRVAKAIAQNSSISLFHATNNRQSVASITSVMQTEPRISRVVTGSNGIVHGILREAKEHKVVVLGATFTEPEIKTSRTSPVIEDLITRLDQPIVLVRSWHPENTDFHPPIRRPIATETLSTKVDRWFAQNTFHSHEFSDISTLMALKERQGVTISIGLPALNEAETIGNIIKTVKKPLMEDFPLIDEIVLIDSNSTDETVPIAQSLGIPTYNHPEIAPEMGSYRGKGEALWKSLHVLKGDIIAWIDTDITNIHPRFIYGLLGPLLHRPQLQFVKGFYQRPITVDGQLQATGGGRVTELVARPMLNLFYPELSGIIQPLSGEYAGRRAALESIPFFSGYGVETGMLIDLHQRYGLESIAQVDLEERIHYNQPLVGLSKMAFSIIQVFVDRLEDRYGVSLLEHANQSMKLIVSEPERFALDIVEIGDIERPPMNTVHSYQNQYGQTILRGL